MSAQLRLCNQFASFSWALPGSGLAGGEQVVAGAIRNEAERSSQEPSLQVVTHQPAGAYGDAKARHGCLQAEVEVFEGLGRCLVIQGLPCILLPA